MRTSLSPIHPFVALLGAGALIAFTGCSNDQAKVAALQGRVDSLTTEMNKVNAERAMIAGHLVRFDSLDYDVYTHQKWDQLHVSHASDIVVTYPDGHQTTDIGTHIEELKPMFVFAPDTRITKHEVMFGSGDWTCVTGAIDGTFSQPMPIGGGKTIPPTNKTFHLPMCTVAQWKDGQMIAENLYWDDQTLLKQIGLAQ